MNGLAFVVWAGLWPIAPFFALAWALEGGEAVAASLRALGFSSWAAVAYLAWAATLTGYGLWNRLLARYPAATVSPMALLVPVFGMGASALLLGEPLQAWKLGAAALVIGGLAVNVLGPRWTPRARPAAATCRCSTITT